MVSVRVRHEADLAGCVEVLRHVYAHDGYPVQGTEHAEDFLQGAGVTEAWVAEQDGQIIGQVSVGDPPDDDVCVKLWRATHPHEAVAVLGRLFVHPQHRASGAATELVEAAAAWSQRVRQRLVLFGLVKDQAAIRLYERLGWTNYGTVPYHYGDEQTMDAVCFASPKAV